MHLLSHAKNKVKKLIGRDTGNGQTTPRTADWNTKFDTQLRQGPVKLYYWPAPSNPYQTLFYGASTDRFRAVAGTLEDALDGLRSKSGRHICFHLHWLSQLFAGADTDDTRRNVEKFLGNLRIFCSGGGTFIWTVHNLSEHDRTESPFETETRQAIADLAQAIFVHGDAARDAVAAFFPKAAAKLHIIPHGHYIGVYPDVIRPEAARRRLDLPSENTVFLNLGFVRKYKGLSALCEATEGLDHAVVAVAGFVNDNDRADLEALFAGFRQARLYAGWVPVETIQVYMNAADFVVLPYVASLTSGAALLAFSFGVPVVAPALGPFPELIRDGETGFLYDPDEPSALRATLARACATSDAERAAMRVAAYKTASQMTWSAGRATLFKVLVDNVAP